MSELEQLENVNVADRIYELQKAVQEDIPGRLGRKNRGEIQNYR